MSNEMVVSMLDRALAKVDALKMPANINYDGYYEGLDEVRSIRGAEEYIDSVIDYMYGQKSSLGMSTPWGSLSGRVKFRPGELSTWTGYKGHYKSSLVSQCFINGMIQGEKCLVISPEFSVPVLLMRKLRQVSGGSEPSIRFIRAWLGWCRGRLWLYDRQSSIRPRTILGLTAFAAKELGVTQILIDSLMKCGIAPDDYSGQKDFVDKLQNIAHRFNTHVHLITHARKGEDDLKRPSLHDTKGASEINDMAENIFWVHRNKIKERKMADGGSNPDIMSLPDITFGCEVQRNGDWSGTQFLWSDPGSHQFVERQGAPRYDYSSVMDRGEDNVAW